MWGAGAATPAPIAKRAPNTDGGRAKPDPADGFAGGGPEVMAMPASDPVVDIGLSAYRNAMSDKLEDLAVAIEDVLQLLLSHGDNATAPRLPALVDRLRDGDQSAIICTLSEATGGMGSLNDRYLCPENGDRIARSEVQAVNERLAKLVRSVEVKARSAASEYGVKTVR